MDSAPIPHLDGSISRLVLGSMVCTTDDMELTCSLLDAYVGAGGNCIDTAHIYSGGGKSERAIGQWMKERGNRGRIVILTKGAHHNQDRKRVTEYDVAADLHDSLARLKTDYIDLYLLHRDDLEVPVGRIVEWLNEHKEAGRIRAFGGSNWSHQRIQAANDYAAAHGLQGFSASSPHLSLAQVNEQHWQDTLALDAEGRAWHESTQFPLFPWSSQAGGFFTRPFARGDAAPGPTQIQAESPDMVRIYYSDGNFERARRAAELGKQKSATTNQVALAWVLHQPFPIFPLIGPQKLAELQESLGALKLSLGPEEARWLNLESDPA